MYSSAVIESFSVFATYDVNTVDTNVYVINLIEIVFDWPLHKSCTGAPLKVIRSNTDKNNVSLTPGTTREVPTI